MSRPQKVGLFSLKFNGNTHFSTKLQKTHHLEHKSYGKWLSWKTEFLHILIGIKKSFNSSVFLMYLRHLLTSPAPPFHIETVKRRGREKFRTEPPKFVLWCGSFIWYHIGQGWKWQAWYTRNCISFVKQLSRCHILIRWDAYLKKVNKENPKECL